VRFTGPAVRQLQASFAIDWGEATGALLTGDDFFPPPAYGGAPETGVVAGLLSSSATIGSTTAMRFFALAFAAARRTLDVAAGYFVPTDPMVRMLVGAARRGVEVRILTANHRSDVPPAWLAGRARYEELLAGGVRIWEYQPAMMHAKTLVADGHLAAVGAINLDNRSTALMDETSLLSLDAGVAAAVEAVFADSLSRAEEIRLETFSRRPVWERAAEAGIGLFSRLL
jgi:cardiolipin synthase A/B